MRLTLSGIARVLPHTTTTNKRVPQLHFTADAGFEVGDRYCNPDHFDSVHFYGERLLDWKNVAGEVKARNYHTEQRVRITVEQNPKKYWDLLQVEILEPCRFVAKSSLYHGELQNFPQPERLPAAVRKQLAENEAAVAGKTGFARLRMPHGPWVSSTGRPEDVILLKERDLEQKTPQQILAGEDIDPKVRDQFIIEKPDAVLRYAAEHGLLDKIPMEALTRDNLLRRDATGISVLDRAATFRSLHQLPPALVDTSMLTAQNDSGVCALHLGLQIDKDHPRPVEDVILKAVTVDNLLLKTNLDRTPLYFIIRHANWERIPQHVRQGFVERVEGCIHKLAAGAQLAPHETQLVANGDLLPLVTSTIIDTDVLQTYSAWKDSLKHQQKQQAKEID